VSPVTPLAITWFGALVVAMLDARRRTVQWLAVAVLAVSRLAHIAVARDVLSGANGETFAGGWPDGIGIAIRADALGAVFAVLTAGVLLV
jgi:multicomponent Na+:H+ antiporter subunit D